MGAQVSHALSLAGITHRMRSLGIRGEFGQSAYVAEDLYKHHGLTAEKMVEACPCADQVHFTGSGTEATFFALRMARAATGRDRVLKFEGGWRTRGLYADIHGLARPANLVPAITQTAIGKLPMMTVYGDDYPTRDGSCMRDFIHVCDIAHAHTLSLQYMLDKKISKKCEVYNLGTGNGVTVLEAIKAFEKVSSVKLNYQIGPRRVGDVVGIYANNDLATKQLGWQLQYTLEDMLSTAWKWEQKLKTDEKFYNGKFSELN